jgi:predicted metal-dependent RNase
VKAFDFSAHAPRELLFDYIRKVAPRIVVLVHGDPPAVGWFAEKIASELPGTEAVIPEPGKEYEF